MAQKTFQIEGLGEVIVAKRRGSKHLRLSINSKGQVRVGIPNWTPYSAGVTFAKSRQEWIQKHLKKSETQAFKSGDRIGKSYRLVIQPSSAAKVSTRITTGLITVNLPANTSLDAQRKAIVSAAERALKKEALHLLPQRTKQLAKQYGFSFSNLAVKKLTSRWGSCNSKKEISLSFYLMQLPWHLIDYVILHELAHTEHLNHAEKFWDRLSQCVPDLKAKRKEIKQFKPIVSPQN
jgi:predicted metal-dependent hydrolase